MRAVALIGALAVIASRTGTAQATAGLTWGPAPAVFPAGAKLAVLQGDPSGSAMFTIRLDLPDGFVLPSHFHPTDEHVTVIEGTFLVGMGDTPDFAKAKALAPGAFITAGANMHHYAKAKGHTVVQVSAMGPFALTYVNPADDPTRKSASR